KRMRKKIGRAYSGVIIRALTEFTDVVQAPFPNCAVRTESDGIVIATGYHDDIAKIQNLNSIGPVDGGSITQLTVAIQSPSPDVAIGFQCQSVFPARGDGGDIREAGNLNRYETLCIRANTQFAV